LREELGIWFHTLITIGGRSAAATEVAKRAPLSTVAAIEANPVDFMVVIC
jgi:hypothetical protein